MVAALAAKQAGGDVVLRIEDLDPDRSKPHFAEQIIRDLEWFGFEWVGEVLYQSDRLEAYGEALGELESMDLVYPCFCTRADLHAARAPHAGEEYRYAGTCRYLGAAEKAEKAANRNPAMRLIVDGAKGAFEDCFAGSVEESLEDTCGDFIVKRSDGTYAYQLAVVVDDAYQDVTHIIRGNDLLGSTVRQMYLQDLLQLPHPAYGHVPLFVDERGVRLSKRNGDATLEYLIEEARLKPEQILGHLAWIAGLIEAYEPLSLDVLAQRANLDALKNVQAIVWRAPAGI